MSANLVSLRGGDAIKPDVGGADRDGIAIDDLRGARERHGLVGESGRNQGDGNEAMHGQSVRRAIRAIRLPPVPLFRHSIRSRSSKRRRRQILEAPPAELSRSARRRGSSTRCPAREAGIAGTRARVRGLHAMSAQGRRAHESAGAALPMHRMRQSGKGANHGGVGLWRLSNGADRPSLISDPPKPAVNHTGVLIETVNALLPGCTTRVQSDCDHHECGKKNRGHEQHRELLNLRASIGMIIGVPLETALNTNGVARASLGLLKFAYPPPATELTRRPAASRLQITMLGISGVAVV
jgi:hypothetical protein